MQEIEKSCKIACTVVNIFFSTRTKGKKPLHNFLILFLKIEMHWKEVILNLDCINYDYWLIIIIIIIIIIIFSCCKTFVQTQNPTAVQKASVKWRRIHTIWNLKAVIWFHFIIPSLALLPTPIALSVMSVVSFFLPGPHSPGVCPENSSIFFVKR